MLLLLSAPALAQAAPPTGLTGQALDARVELAWQPVTGATSYRVFRGTTATTVTTPLMADPFVPPVRRAAGLHGHHARPTARRTTTRSARRSAASSPPTRAVIRATPRARTCSGGNPVVAENCLPGDADWNVAIQSTSVAGYATAQSINQGESVDLKVQAGTGATKVDLQVFRSGYYGGAGARLFSTMLDVPVAAQPACANDLSVGLYDCSGWSVTQTLTTTASWPSGVYLCACGATDTGDDTHILFVVRDDAARRRRALRRPGHAPTRPTTTSAASRLYDHNSSGARTVAGHGAGRSRSPSTAPTSSSTTSPRNDWYTRTDYATVAWLERSGYDVSYIGGLGPRALRRRGCATTASSSPGAHDEYCSAGDAHRARAGARRAASTSSSPARTRSTGRSASSRARVTARQDRVMVCYKTTQSGPADPSGIPTGTWRDPAGANQPENALTGVHVRRPEDVTYFPLRVTAAQGKDRIWRYTGLDTQATGRDGHDRHGARRLGVGRARDQRRRSRPGVTTLAALPGERRHPAGRGPDLRARARPSRHVVKHTRPSGALIVSTGTNHWNWGLARNAPTEGEPDRRIQQATTNVLVDMGALPGDAAPPASCSTTRPPPPVVAAARRPPNATGVDAGRRSSARRSRAPMDPATITDLDVHASAARRHRRAGRRGLRRA